MRSKVEILEHARYIVLNKLNKTEEILDNTVSLKRREKLEEKLFVLNLINNAILEELRKELV